MRVGVLAAQWGAWQPRTGAGGMAAAVSHTAGVSVDDRNDHKSMLRAGTDTGGDRRRPVAPGGITRLERPVGCVGVWLVGGRSAGLHRAGVGAWRAWAFVRWWFAQIGGALTLGAWPVAHIIIQKCLTVPARARTGVNHTRDRQAKFSKWVVRQRYIHSNERSGWTCRWGSRGHLTTKLSRGI